MKYVYLKANEDEAIIRDFKDSLSNYTLEELVERYNREARCGIVGVRRQSLFHIALRKEFLERLEQSPITIEDRMIIDLSGEIEVVNGEIVVLKNEEIQ